ncbi:hypothetical protein SBOR_1958 [Sclerotinia borealis F-4128]|uniref:Cyanovirin-N domain-containing protein n=1 Tax=Sclerotinia borealis (strain F-4128) TaxID=1432307 RepID=W9CLG1_SCLBF|nr:hypothetical protein SBOR_1958 [Sclerotinia borealis F-4128]
MHFTQAASAILATLAFSSTVLAGVLKTADSFCSSAAGCTWQNPADWKGVLECSCNLASPDGTSVLLIQGYTDWNYEGFVFNGYSTTGCVGDYAVIDKNGISEMQGIYDHGVQSYICDPLTS